MNSLDPGSVPPLASIQEQSRQSTSSSTARSSQDNTSATATSSSQNHANGALNRRSATKVNDDAHPEKPSKTGATSSSKKPSKPTSYPLFAGDRPWSQRSWAYELMPFRGMWYDLRRRKPFFVSDWTEGLEPRNWWTIVNSVIRMYFINLMPALAYILDMNYRTGGSYGVNEVILASALAAIVFSLFSVQPLTFVGVTGLINLVNYTQYNIFVGYYGFDRMNYLRIQAWSLIWAAGFHFIVAIFNVCDFTRFITDMTSETFGFYVGIIYIQKGIELLIEEFEPAPLDNATGWLSVTIAILFTVSVYLLAKVGNTTYLPFRMRNLVAGYAFAAGCIFWTGFSHFPNNSLRKVGIERLPITKSFFPTIDRSWFVDFWNIELKYVFVGAPLGFLIMLLFYFDHNVSSVMAQARHYPVKKPAGFHWDFFLLGITTLVSGFLGLPAPNGLVPQAPVHTETLSVYQQIDKLDVEKKIARETIGKGRSKKKIQTVKQQHIVNARVVENRISHLAIGLLTLGTMTRPLLVVLGLMPRAVFAGIFILVGWASIERNGITMRTIAIFRDRRLTPAEEPLNTLRKSKIALYVGIQWLFAAMTIAISATIAGIGFPVIIVLLIPIRYWLVPKWFSPLELKILDAPTADADGVLASLGHEPERVTGRGVEVALDTKIAGTLYYKRSLDQDSDDDEEDHDHKSGPSGEALSASQYREKHASGSQRHHHKAEDVEAQGGQGQEDSDGDGDGEDEDAEHAQEREIEKAEEENDDEPVKTVLGISGHRSADPQIHTSHAVGGGVLAAGLGTGAQNAVADEEKEEEALHEASPSSQLQPQASSAAGAAVATTSSSSTNPAPEPARSQFVENVENAGSNPSPKSSRKKRYVSVENPPRGPGSPPPPVQWRGRPEDA